MKIAVIGAGAIGSLVAGYLKLKQQDVTLVCRPETVSRIARDGLRISGVRGEFNVAIDTRERLDASADVAILATKTQDVEAAVRENQDFLECSAVLTTQNGVQADSIVSRYIPPETIISSIVMFGATSLAPGEVVHNFEGAWLLGRPFIANDSRVAELGVVLDAVTPTIITEELRGMKYLKIFVNANNCIPAVLGVSMQDAFSNIGVSRISVAMWKEGLEVVRRARIPLVSLPDFPLERLTGLAAMPLEQAARVVSGVMVNLSDTPLYGSILQSIKRGRRSEIDYINGEFVRIASENDAKAPLNKKLVEMVHRVEETGTFFTVEELFQETAAFTDTIR